MPPALTGIWYFDAIPSQITLDGNDYDVQQPANKAHGNVVVNGDEIDFYNGDACERQHLDGIGRYRWQLQGSSSVHFTPLNSDPCGRSEILVNQTWARTTTLH